MGNKLLFESPIFLWSWTGLFTAILWESWVSCLRAGTHLKEMEMTGAVHCRLACCFYFCICICRALFISQKRHFQSSNLVISVRGKVFLFFTEVYIEMQHFICSCQLCCISMHVQHLCLLKVCFRFLFKIFVLFSETSRYGSNKPEETKLSSLAYSNARCEFFTRNSLIHGCPQNK